nr:hypothetical protein [Tanacetum cinerariifolium]
MGDAHPDTVPATESDEFIKSSVENLVPIPSESEGESECDVPAHEEFITFSNILFDAEYESDSSDDQSFYDEDVPNKIFSNPLFEEEIIPMKIDQHHDNAESDIIESLHTHDSSLIILIKIDSLLDEFADELALLKSIPPGIDETDCDFKEDIRLIEKLLYDNSSPQIDLSFISDYPMPPGIKDDDYDCEREILISEDLPSIDTLSIPKKESFHFDIPSFSRPPAKPPDGNTRILHIKMMGDISDQKVPMPKLMITLALHQEKSPDLLSHWGLKAFLHSATCPMMIHGKNIPILDVPLVSQMCDKKNNVLFTDTEYLVLSSDFKLPDESQVLLRVPRENNMYNVNLKNIVLSEDLTCLFSKATLDESNLWHKRLAHINFKTINKLVKGNLVRGFPTKVFENDHTCVACKKGKQHRASCKTKPVSFVDQPLFRLHMDLFGPNFVKSMNKKSYFLVIIDDYSRFTWVFFLATKDETAPILKTFLTGLENQLSLKLKVIRSDNGTEFKNSDLNQFYSLLPIPFWAEAVNTACYVQNRVLVTKPHNKTPYELLHGRTPSIGFMRPFSCPVTILNTLDPLGKFQRKVDEGFLVGYSVCSKAFRVFNSRTRIIQETLHVIFLENKPNVAGTGPTWLFDIDSLTKTMNYQPVHAGNQTNSGAGFQDNFDAKKAGEEVDQSYMLFPVWSAGSTNPQNNADDAAFNGKEHDFDVKKPESKVILSLSSSAQSKEQDDKTKKEAKGKSPVESVTGYRDLNAEFQDCSKNNSNESKLDDGGDSVSDPTLYRNLAGSL